MNTFKRIVNFILTFFQVGDDTEWANEESDLEA